MEHYFKVLNQPSKEKSGFFPFLSGLTLTTKLVIVNVFIFLILILTSAIMGADNYTIFVFNYLALQPNNLFIQGYVWTLLTSMFMHAGIGHLFVNMLSLLFLGRFLEKLIGKTRFFWLYIFSGIFAGLFFAFFAFYFGVTPLGERLLGNPQTFAVGASGAIFALAGVLAILTPKNKVYFIAGPLIAIILSAILSDFILNQAILSILDLLLNAYILFSIFSIISFNPSLQKWALPVKISFRYLPILAIVPLFIIGLFVALPIGNMAHLGGFIAGFLYGLYLKYKYPKKVSVLNNYFS